MLANAAGTLRVPIVVISLREIRYWLSILMRVSNPAPRQCDDIRAQPQRARKRCDAAGEYRLCVDRTDPISRSEMTTLSLRCRQKQFGDGDGDAHQGPAGDQTGADRLLVLHHHLIDPR